MTTQTDLAEAFRRLTSALAWLDDQPDGPDRAHGIRLRLAGHMTELADGLAGKTKRCERHDRHMAHNCPACRSERIGRNDDAAEHLSPTTTEEN